MATILLAWVAFSWWHQWYQQHSVVFPQHPLTFGRILLKITPVISTAMLFYALRYKGAAALHQDFDLFLLYLIAGFVLLGLLQWISPWLGISLREDVLER